jgi:hypothetical protein
MGDRGRPEEKDQVNQTCSAGFLSSSPAGFLSSTTTTRIFLRKLGDGKTAGMGGWRRRRGEALGGELGVERRHWEERGGGGDERAAGSAVANGVAACPTGVEVLSGPPTDALQSDHLLQASPAKKNW